MDQKGIKMNEKQIKAKERRYKKAICRDLNLESMKETLWDMYSECEDIRWIEENGRMDLASLLDDDDDEAAEFSMMFSDLSNDLYQMLQDIKNEYIPKYFDDFFTAAGVGSMNGGLLGYDSYECDYYGIQPVYNKYAEESSRERIMRLPKNEILEAAFICTRVFQQFLSVRTRYEDLKASIDILKDKNNGQLKIVKQIEETYEAFSEHGIYTKEERNWDRLVAEMPQEAWIS